MHKKIRILNRLCVILSGFLLFFNACAENPEKSYSEYSIHEMTPVKEFWQNAKQSDTWRSPNRRKRGELLNLPEDLLTELDTETLVETVLAYPFLMDVYAYDDKQAGMDRIYQTFNGMRELASRPDAAGIILEKYIAEPVLSESGSGSIFNLLNLEILLAQDFVTDHLTEEQYAELLTAMQEKDASKQESECYTGFENLFYELQNNRMQMT